MRKISWFLCGWVIVAGMGSLCHAGDVKGEAKSEFKLSPQNVYDAAMHYLVSGDQRGTEQVLGEAIAIYPRDSRLLFFAAACQRSRFDVPGSAKLFVRAYKADPNGVYGRAARSILLLDFKGDRDGFRSLGKIENQRQDEPLFTWMMAVECRSLNENEIGVAYYEKLAKTFNPGPVLFHQTYANLLDQVHRYPDALEHRKVAVKLEPATWSYSAMGDTLTHMGKWKEADEAYNASVQIQEDDFHTWLNWSWSMQKRGDNDGCIEKCERALELNPDYTMLYNRMGDAYLRRHSNARDGDEAERCYRKAIECSPRDPYAYNQLAVCLDGKGDRAGAEKVREKKAEQGIASVNPGESR